MKKCYNMAIYYFYKYMVFFCLNNKDLFNSSTDYNRLSVTRRKEYLKSAFDTVAIEIQKNVAEKIMPKYQAMVDNNTISDTDRAELEKYKQVLEVAEVIKSGVEKEQSKANGSADKICCFLHKDQNPSMTYAGKSHGFHCFLCNKKDFETGTGTVIDIFNLISLVSEWENKGSLKFSDQIAVAEKLFVNGEVKADNPEEHSDFIKYTKEMVRVMFSNYYGFIKVKEDNCALTYLKNRGISPYTATKLGVMTEYPKTIAGNPNGKAYMVFINSDGSFAKRLFMEDKEKTAKYCSGDNERWLNKAGSGVGVFNGQVVEHCQKYNQVLFICEGAFDCLSCEELGFHSVAINGVGNIHSFYREYIYGKNIKCVCLSDTDSAGKEMAVNLAKYSNNKVYVPDFYTAEESSCFLAKHKDMNECIVADRNATYKALKELEDKANKYFSEIKGDF